VLELQRAHYARPAGNEQAIAVDGAEPDFEALLSALAEARATGI